MSTCYVYDCLIQATGDLTLVVHLVVELFCVLGALTFQTLEGRIRPAQRTSNGWIVSAANRLTGDRVCLSKNVFHLHICESV